MKPPIALKRTEDAAAGCLEQPEGAFEAASMADDQKGFHCIAREVHRSNLHVKQDSQVAYDGEGSG